MTQQTGTPIRIKLAATAWQATQEAIINDLLTRFKTLQAEQTLAAARQAAVKLTQTEREAGWRWLINAKLATEMPAGVPSSNALTPRYLKYAAAALTPGLRLEVESTCAEKTRHTSIHLLNGCGGSITQLGRIGVNGAEELAPTVTLSVFDASQFVQEVISALPFDRPDSDTNAVESCVSEIEQTVLQLPGVAATTLLDLLPQGCDATLQVFAGAAQEEIVAWEHALRGATVGTVRCYKDANERPEQWLNWAVSAQDCIEIRAAAEQQVAILRSSRQAAYERIRGLLEEMPENILGQVAA